ncbi:hypothetical protein GGR28_000171 [Lewinella aquimaris]|uniref:Arginase n=1 Tax=Neolewinella aquimaris TaxID=1835722 RepID=A0A840DXB1_9BACT|nr:hypothetical protein [Neolewinella aquimaris]MBB4077570.1 hypothetical protein [Neolewinella aquimaris]
MYSTWLSSSPLDPTTFGPASVAGHLTADPSPTTRVALIGVNAATADAVRHHLYSHYWDFGGLDLVDLGNLRKQTIDFTIPLLRELYSAGIVPILLGDQDRMLSAQYLAFGELNRQVGIFAVDQRVNLRSSGELGPDRALDAAIYREAPPVFHLSHAGSQRHLVDPGLEYLFAARHFENYPLGQSRANLADLEPAIRDADLFALGLGAIQWSEAPAQGGHHPSGFSLQEASQLCYYAGNSDRLASFGLYGFDLEHPNQDGRQLTAAAYAQLAWYFLHGLSRRVKDFPVSLTGMAEYVVDTTLAGRLTFWRSPRSSRWWVQVPTETYRGEARNRLVSCSYQDYLTSSKEGKLPDRILSAFSRY